MSNESEDKIYITWARCCIASLVGVVHALNRVGELIGEMTNCTVIVYGRVGSETTNSPVKFRVIMCC